MENGLARSAEVTLLSVGNGSVRSVNVTLLSVGNGLGQLR